FLYYHRTSGELLAERLQLFRELFRIGRDKVILYVVEALEPERRNLVEHRALVRNRVVQNHIKSRDAIRGDKEQRLPEVEHFAHLTAAEFLDSQQLDGGLCSDLHGQTLIAQRSTFNVQFSRFVERCTLSVGRWTLVRVLYGRNRCQTTRPNFARTRLGLFQRSPEGFWQSSGWRGDFTEGRQGSSDWERHYNSKSQIVARRFSRRRQDLDF